MLYRFWMQNFPHQFDLDAALVQSIKDLQESATDDNQVDCSLIDLSNTYVSSSNFFLTWLLRCHAS